MSCEFQLSYMLYFYESMTAMAGQGITILNFLFIEWPYQIALFVLWSFLRYCVLSLWPSMSVLYKGIPVQLKKTSYNSYYFTNQVKINLLIGAPAVGLVFRPRQCKTYVSGFYCGHFKSMSFKNEFLTS